MNTIKLGSVIEACDELIEGLSEELLHLDLGADSVHIPHIEELKEKTDADT